jgi:hypothetical protein
MERSEEAGMKAVMHVAESEMHPKFVCEEALALDLRPVACVSPQ